jgi:hypothetical protein
VSPAVRQSARLAAWVVGLSAAVSAVGGVLERHRAGSIAVQAFVAEWGAGRLGVAWSDPEAPPPTVRRVLERVGIGLALGILAAFATLAFAAATHAVAFRSPRVPGFELLLGLVVLGLVSMRDELILRGLVLRAFGHTLSRPLQIAACGVVAAAAKLGQLEGSPLAALSHAPGVVSVVHAALAAVCFATLWIRQRGAFMAWAAHTAWSLGTTTAISGGVCDGLWGASAWGGGGGGGGGGGSGVDGSLAVAIGLGAVTLVALSTWYRAGGRTR